MDITNVNDKSVYCMLSECAHAHLQRGVEVCGVGKNAGRSEVWIENPFRLLRSFVLETYGPCSSGGCNGFYRFKHKYTYTECMGLTNIRAYIEIVKKLFVIIRKTLIFCNVIKTNLIRLNAI